MTKECCDTLSRYAARVRQMSRADLTEEVSKQLGSNPKLRRQKIKQRRRTDLQTCPTEHAGRWFGL
jgi:ribosomal protein L20A (L18A)